MRIEQNVQDTLKFMENILFDKTFRDNEGNIVIVQPPNLPILVIIVATVLNLVVKNCNIHTGLDAVAFGSLFTWAWLELFEGINYFRRALGFLVLIGLIVSRFFNNF